MRSRQPGRGGRVVRGVDSYKPQVLLGGLSEEGFCIAWDPFTAGRLVAGDNAGTLAGWVVDALVNKPLPDVVFDGPTIDVQGEGKGNAVNSLQFSPITPDALVAGFDSGHLAVYDVRKPPMPSKTIDTGSCVNVCRFSPFDATIVATGHPDGVVNVWDLSKPASPLHTLTHHSGDVFHLEWSPHNQGVLATGADDSRVLVWDLSGDHASASASVSGSGKDEMPPELWFVHAGHTDVISGLSWSPSCPMLIASCAEDNSLQLWAPASQQVDGEDMWPPTKSQSQGLRVLEDSD
ncbi:hypothetical protein KIPB_007050 [Kipferlia bialata]|uniref:Uncharacterized protein n=1 Tax=Kipferlia bialata TaxID=797122 RepID=A0A391NUS0_9EUKA|nr:hypothetical protein KIPB_007050 [Kipferlia bialata]|eukprot:g7050.t1